MFKILTIAAFVGVCGCAYAQSELPPNTIDCKQFTKSEAHTWSETGVVVFDLGRIKGTRMTNNKVIPNSIDIGGYDLYDVLEKKCGGSI